MNVFVRECDQRNERFLRRKEGNSETHFHLQKTRAVTIETNLDALNFKELEKEICIDPLLRKVFFFFKTICKCDLTLLLSKGVGSVR